MDIFNFWSLVTILFIGGWVVTTWIRAKHGYPVENSFGGMTNHPEHNQGDHQNNIEMENKVLALE